LNNLFNEQESFEFRRKRLEKQHKLGIADYFCDTRYSLYATSRLQVAAGKTTLRATRRLRMGTWTDPVEKKIGRMENLAMAA
jgi:hypothetical protein